MTCCKPLGFFKNFSIFKTSTFKRYIKFAHAPLPLDFLKFEYFISIFKTSAFKSKKLEFKKYIKMHTLHSPWIFTHMEFHEHFFFSFKARIFLHVNHF